MKKLLPLALLVGVAAAFAIGYWWPFGNGGDVQRLPGIVEIQEVRLGSKIGGRVDAKLVEEGDLVSPGQTLITFEVPELSAQRDQWQARLKAAEAELERSLNGYRIEEKKAAEAAVDAAKARYDRLEEGFRKEEKDQAFNEFKAAEADHRFAEDDLVRIDLLYQRNSASKAELEAARASRDRSQGRLGVARAKHEMMKAGARKEDIAEARALWKQAQAEMEKMYTGTRHEDIDLARAKVAEMKAKLEEIEVHLKEADVIVPKNLGRAVVEVVSVRPGDLVPANQPVVRVLRAEDMWVKVFVPETKLGLVKVNETVEVKIDSHAGQRFQGKVIQVANIAEFTPRNVQSVDERRHQVFAVKVQVGDPQGRFHAGMAAEVFIPISNR